MKNYLSLSIITVIILIRFPAISYTQNMLTLSLNAPRDSDELHKCRTEYSDPGKAGHNICWDFSKARILEKSYIVKYSVDSLSDITAIEHNSMYRLQVSSKALRQTNYEDPTTIIKYDHTMLLQTYPFSLDMKVSSSYKGKGMYCGNHAMNIAGNIEQEADGSGIIILSERDTLKNVLRIHTIRSSSIAMYADTCITDSVDRKQEIEETYQWYARGYRYPVYETVSRTSYDNLTPIACCQFAFLYQPEDQRILSDALNQKIATSDSAEYCNKEHEKDINHSNDASKIIKYTIHSNDNIITVDYDLTAQAHITVLVCDLNGILYKHMERDDAAGKEYTLQMDCNNLRRDRYVLYLNVNGKIYNEIINLE